MGGEVNASLNLDLSHLTFQLKNVEQQVSAHDQRIAAVQARADRMRQRVEETSRLQERLEARVRSIAKTQIRQGVGFGASHVVERFSGDSHAGQLIGGIAQGTIAGGMAGGPAGAVVGAISATVFGLVDAFKRHQQELEAERKNRKEAMEEVRRRLALAEALAKENERLAEINRRYEQQQITKRARETAYRMSMYAARRN